MMILNQGKVAGGMFQELMDVIDKYDDSTYLPTVLGVLDLVKWQLIENHIEEEDEDD